MSADPSADLCQDVHQDLNRLPARVDGAVPSRWIRWPVFLVVALCGFGLRLPQLGARPMHTDEAVNAYIVGQLLAGDAFTYDSQDRHGPALFVLALPLVRMQGGRTFSDLTESELRLAAVLAGTVTILLFGAAVEIFGFLPCLIAAALFAGASLPVYYDRYFIHESLFVAVTFAWILSGWRACATKSIAWAALAGACAAFMLACKETAIIHFFAGAAAATIFWLWNWRGKSLAGLLRVRAVAVAAGSFLLVFLAVFTWFGRTRNAPGALLKAVPHFLARAGGEGHQKPFWYYGQLLTNGWSGGLLLALACFGVFLTIRKRDPSAFGFLAYYALFLSGIYSLIPYKTPWLALNFWVPIALFAGRAVESLWRVAAKSLNVRAAIPAFGILGTLAAACIAHDTRQRVFKQPADEMNPYAYAHTSEDLLGLPPEIDELASQNAIKAPRIAVIASDPWPLPWYLRHFTQVGFWQPGQQVGEADFYITSTEAAEQYADRFRDFRPEFFGVRPGVLILLWSPARK
jgi:uncharacterized protein (TIGR03663 family)